MKRCSWVLCAGLAALILMAAASCVAEPEKKTAKTALGYGERPAGYQYKRIPGANLALRFIGPANLKAGKKTSVAFELKNVGSKTIRVEEWYMNTQDNLKVYVQVWLPGQQKPDPKRWLLLSPPVKMPDRRYNLELFPDNRTLVDVELGFLEDLFISPGAERRYYIQAQLNLKSVSAVSPAAAFAVLPAD